MIPSEVDIVEGKNLTPCLGTKKGNRDFTSPFPYIKPHTVLTPCDQMSVVLFIIENILPVYTSKHHMIDACSARFSWTSCHILSLIWHKGKKDIANHQIILQKSHKGTDPLCDGNHCTKRKPRKEKSKRGFLLYYRTGGLSPCVTNFGMKN